MVNKTFILIILTVLVLGVIFYLVSNYCNCLREGFQENNGTDENNENNGTDENNETDENNRNPKFFADLDDDTDYDFLTSNITKIKAA